MQTARLQEKQERTLSGQRSLPETLVWRDSNPPPTLVAGKSLGQKAP
jgi:hypothetical protein